MHKTAVRAAAVLSLLVASLSLAACSKQGGAAVTAIWQFDEARTLERADKGAPILKGRLAGMTIDLQFRADNSFTLAIVGGPEPSVTEGSFKTKFGGMILSTKSAEGKPVPPSSLHLKSTDPATLEMMMAGNTIILTRR